MEIAQSGRTEPIRPVRGHAVFVPDHAWNKPDWTGRVDVVTFLFGVKQIGISLVRHKGGSQVPATALKASVHGGYDVPTHSTLSTLMVLAADHSKGPLARLSDRIHAARLPAAVKISAKATPSQSHSNL